MKSSEIGQIIRERREENGLSKAQLAGQCGCTEDAIRRVEEGKTEPSVMMLALKELHISLGEL